MDTDEGLARFIGIDPRELPDNVKLRTGKQEGPQKRPHPRRELIRIGPARREPTSASGYPLPGAPVRADVLDATETEAVVCGDEDHGPISLYKVGCIRRSGVRFSNFQ